MLTIEENVKNIFSDFHDKCDITELRNKVISFVIEQDRIARQEERERCVQTTQKLLCENCTLGNNECSICGDYGTPSVTGWVCKKRLLIREAIEAKMNKKYYSNL